MIVPRRRASRAALLLAAGVALGLAPASAQTLDESTRHALDFAPGSLLRSPGLLGMGRLVLVGDDVNNRIELWDFAGNPAGIYDDDTVSTLELRPGTASLSRVHDLIDRGAFPERQDLAARDQRLGYEVWRRDRESGSAYGAVGEFSRLRFDRPTADDIEQRTIISRPSISPVLAGRMPYLTKTGLRYALRLQFAGNSVTDEFRRLVHNARGEYIDLDGVTVNAPDLFSPDETRLSTTGAGLALSLPLAGRTTAALAFDAVRHDIRGTNEGPRNASERHEPRPYSIGQATLVGRVGKNLAWGLDGHAWTSSSEQDWAFTTSAGIAATPLRGRGKLLERKEEGSTMNSRLRWAAGGWVLGAAYQTAYRKVTITAPDTGDKTSFNVFRDEVFMKAGADTLALPDSVTGNELQDREIEIGGGIARALPRGRGSIGVEVHWTRAVSSQALDGGATRSTDLSLRAGAEVRCNPVLTGRAGYTHRWIDEDEFTHGNEFLSDGGSLGMGFRPVGSSWSLESGYAIEFPRARYGDPTRPRASRQELLTRVRWTF